MHRPLLYKALWKGLIIKSRSNNYCTLFNSPNGRNSDTKNCSNQFPSRSIHQHRYFCKLLFTVVCLAYYPFSTASATLRRAYDRAMWGAHSNADSQCSCLQIFSTFLAEFHFQRHHIAQPWLQFHSVSFPLQQISKCPVAKMPENQFYPSILMLHFPNFHQHLLMW